MKKITRFIPENSTELHERFIRTMMLQGKKSIARKIWKNTLIEIAKKSSKNPEVVFDRAVENTKPVMEVRPKRVGGAVYQVPMEVKPHRQLSLAFKWIIGAARGMKGAPIFKRLASAILEASDGQGPAVKKREDVHRMAQANKAFAHLSKY
ncbi:MAG: 30S ribosomal protein S7 [Candidatus Peregrinibacteria bacterium GW2011_GWA2_47_7]|nr:MAG: 30S ribosomal protein S7 [Candidatus Peregrinibacteria bacterium GW2011_GWA2_47_7]